MLQVDLAQLDRERRVRVETDIAVEELGIDRPDLVFRGPVAIRLEAVRAGTDVVVRGSIGLAVELPCRRCLVPVSQRIGEDVTLLFGTDAGADAAEDVWPLPRRARTLDLAEPVREQVVLAAPAYVLCAEQCRGLCPLCGVNRNETSCTCTAALPDDRWAALREWKSE